MNSSVTCASATSVMSSRCLEIRPRRRSNGPSNTSRCTSNGAERPRPVSGVVSGAVSGVVSAVAGASGEAPLSGPMGGPERSGGVAAGDELTGELTVGLGAGVRGGVGGDRLGGHRGVGELHGAADDRVED